MAYITYKLLFPHLTSAIPRDELNLNLTPNAATICVLLVIDSPILHSLFLGIEFKFRVAGIHFHSGLSTATPDPHCPSLGEVQPSLQVTPCWGRKDSTCRVWCTQPAFAGGGKQALCTHWLTLWYSLAMPWWVQSFPRVGKMWPRVSDLNEEEKEKNKVKLPFRFIAPFMPH